MPRELDLMTPGPIAQAYKPFGIKGRFELVIDWNSAVFLISAGTAKRGIALGWVRK